MLVSTKSPGLLHFCCKYHYPEFGHSPNTRMKTKLRRQLKARERRTWKKEIAA